jgi:hypothetical protein
MPGRGAPVQRAAPKAYDIVAGRGVGKRLKTRAKKEPSLPAALVDNREASNRVDRSHSMSKSWTIIVMKVKA